MRELVEYVIKKIANNPNNVKVQEKKGEGAIILEVFLAEEDRDKIIGKGARIANALRVIVEEIARKVGKLVIMRISDR